MRGKHGQHKLDRIRQLNRNDGIIRQARFDKVRRERGDRAISFGEGQTLCRKTCDPLFVDGIKQRQRVRLSSQYSSKQHVERRRCGGLDHGITSGFGPAVATKFPGDSRSAQWHLAFLSHSTARSIALER